jgi:hypothetical protein
MHQKRRFFHYTITEQGGATGIRGEGSGGQLPRGGRGGPVVLNRSAKASRSQYSRVPLGLQARKGFGNLLALRLDLYLTQRLSSPYNL